MVQERKVVVGADVLRLQRQGPEEETFSFVRSVQVKLEVVRVAEEAAQVVESKVVLLIPLQEGREQLARFFLSRCFLLLPPPP